MKKFLAFILTAIMLISISACTANEGELILTTGGTGGSYYPYGGAMATILTDNITDISVTSTASGASTENARLLNSKEADLAILQNDVLDYAYNGIEIFKDEGGALTNLATIATLYPEVIQIVVTADSGITSINDLKGKNISVGAAGSGTEANARQILEVYGIKYEDLGKVEYLSFAESSTAVQNMTLDGFFCTAGVPNPSILELNTARKIIILSIDADKSDALIAKYPFYAKYDIGEGIYEGIGGATTVAVMATLACRKDLSTDIVYNITKVLFEKKADLAAANDKASLLDVNTAINGVSVPLHPGAEKYYKEVGVIK